MQQPPFQRRSWVSWAALATVNAPKLQPIEPAPDMDPLTGQPWAFPFSRKWLTREEFEREYSQNGDKP